ncbi:hypothetical protein [Polyangium sp. y55x31]|nr:hypothetical protein [Polyangium sp. y55x31]MDI1479707.1 hypothetical protein [Polyangium sp. y55x31]
MHNGHLVDVGPETLALLDQAPTAGKELESPTLAREQSLASSVVR